MAPSPYPNSRDPAHAWLALPRTDQCHVLRLFSRIHSAAIQRKYSDVVAVGMAHLGGSDGDRPCLGFLVDARVVSSDWTMPPAVTIALPYRGTMQSFTVPTVVRPLGAGGPQANDNAAEGILAVSPENARDAVDGAACCIVRKSVAPGAGISLVVITCWRCH
jgi:hypothetical protein